MKILPFYLVDRWEQVFLIQLQQIWSINTDILEMWVIKTLFRQPLSIRPKSWLSIRGILKWEESDKTKSKTETAINFDLTPKFDDFGTKTMYNSRQKALTTAVMFSKALPGKRAVYGKCWI